MFFYRVKSREEHHTICMSSKVVLTNEFKYHYFETSVKRLDIDMKEQK